MKRIKIMVRVRVGVRVRISIKIRISILYFCYISNYIEYNDGSNSFQPLKLVKIL